MISYTTTRYFPKKAKFSSNIHSYKSASKSLKKLYLIKRQEFDNNVLLLSYKKYTGHFSRIFCLYFYLLAVLTYFYLFNSWFSSANDNFTIAQCRDFKYLVQRQYKVWDGKINDFKEGKVALLYLVIGTKNHQLAMTSSAIHSSIKRSSCFKALTGATAKEKSYRGSVKE